MQILKESWKNCSFLYYWWSFGQNLTLLLLKMFSRTRRMQFIQVCWFFSRQSLKMFRPKTENSYRKKFLSKTRPSKCSMFLCTSSRHKYFLTSQESASIRKTSCSRHLSTLCTMYMMSLLLGRSQVPGSNPCTRHFFKMSSVTFKHCPNSFIANNKVFQIINSVFRRGFLEKEFLFHWKFSLFF